MIPAAAGRNGGMVVPTLCSKALRFCLWVTGASSFLRAPSWTDGDSRGLHSLDIALSCLLLPVSRPEIVCVKWKGCCFKLHWCFINMLNDHIQAIFSYYSALCNALVMNGSTLLKDLPINQLNMEKKSHCLFMRSGKEIIESRPYIASYSENIMKHWLYVCH